MQQVLAVAFITAAAVHTAVAREAPNPLVFLANVSSLQDQCVALHLATKEDMVTLEAQSSAEDREFSRLLKTSPEYGPVLVNAQAEILKLPMEKVAAECACMHEQANRRPGPGRS